MASRKQTWQNHLSVFRKGKGNISKNKNNNDNFAADQSYRLTETGEEFECRSFEVIDGVEHFVFKPLKKDDRGETKERVVPVKWADKHAGEFPVFNPENEKTDKRAEEERAEKEKAEGEKGGEGKGKKKGKK
ncbi:hypothetical protein DL98DRAFT_530159 [Cadophora sp. DSE1049]|nr:hypothetical protein DL98DRAFT_530159 [Cadophora sp. DSE1049]